MEYKLRITSELFPANQYQKNNDGDYYSSYPEMKCFNQEATEAYFYELVNVIPIDNSINDWSLLVVVTIGGAMDENEIAITKRGITYSQTKEKEVAVRIPIPTNKVVHWGIEKKHRFNNASKPNEKHSILISVDYSQFQNMTDYLETNIRLGLSEILKRGITLKGHKIKM